MLRYINNLKLKNEKKSIVHGILQTSELQKSFLRLCRLAQPQSFPNKYETLSKGLSLSSKSKFISLTPFYSTDDNVIRVGGRIDSSTYSYNKKHPILLDASHRFTNLIFQYEHIRYLHAGQQLLLGIIKNYIGRRLARQTVRYCVKCRRFQARPLEPIMGNLPSQRVTPNFPFTSVGIDFAGPFLILNRKGPGSKLVKWYLCLLLKIQKLAPRGCK